MPIDDSESIQILIWRSKVFFGGIFMIVGTYEFTNMYNNIYFTHVFCVHFAAQAMHYFFCAWTWIEAILG